MPAKSREMIEAMACLGGRAELSVLQTATDAPASVVEEQLAPALGEGLLVVEPGLHEAVRFRHDRIRRGGPGPTGSAAAPRAAVGGGAATGRGAAVIRGRRRAVPIGRRHARRPRGAAHGGGVVAARRRPGRFDRRPRAGERAARGGAATDRPGAHRHADRGAHPPPERPVQPGRLEEADEEYRGIEELLLYRGDARRRDVRAGPQPDSP